MLSTNSRQNTNRRMSFRYTNFTIFRGVSFALSKPSINLQNWFVRRMEGSKQWRQIWIRTLQINALTRRKRWQNKLRYDTTHSHSAQFTDLSSNGLTKVGFTWATLGVFVDDTRAVGRKEITKIIKKLFCFAIFWFRVHELLYLLYLLWFNILLVHLLPYLGCCSL